MGWGLNDPVPKRARREVAPAEEEHKKVQFESTGNERLLFGEDGKYKGGQVE